MRTQCIQFVTSFSGAQLSIRVDTSFHIFVFRSYLCFIFLQLTSSNDRQKVMYKQETTSAGGPYVRVLSGAQYYGKNSTDPANLFVRSSCLLPSYFVGDHARRAPIFAKELNRPSAMLNKVSIFFADSATTAQDFTYCAYITDGEPCHFDSFLF